MPTTRLSNLVIPSGARDLSDFVIPSGARDLSDFVIPSGARDLQFRCTMPIPPAA